MHWEIEELQAIRDGVYEIAQETIMNLHTCMPGTIVKVNEEGLANIRVDGVRTFNTRNNETRYLPFPPLLEVPLYGALGGNFTCQARPGSPVIVLFAEECPDGTYEKWSLSNAIAVFLSPLNKKVAQTEITSADSILIHSDQNICLNTHHKLSIKNDVHSLKEIVKDIQSVLASLLVGAGIQLQGGQAATFNAEAKIKALALNQKINDLLED